MLITCQAGYETLLAREARALGVVAQGPGWVRTTHEPGTELAFAYLLFRDAKEISGDSVNGLAQQIADIFLESLRGERIEAAWPCVFLAPQEIVGLNRRVSGVEKAFIELLRKKLARIAKLAVPELPRGMGEARGLFVYFTDFGKACVTRSVAINGQRRMADDDLAPSRSYLKVEEAFVVLGREPVAGETVVDLGAAPGGWSYSAAKRGAHVVAIDNGPLKGGAKDNPLIEHRCEDAFRFQPSFTKALEGEALGVAAFDWLFCDMVEEPHHVLRDIVEPWLERGWCRRFVINLKFGRVDAVALLDELRDPKSVLMRYAPGLRVRHLYHDREEFTLVGEVTGGREMRNG